METQTTTSNPSYGLLASRFCGVQLPLQALRSGTGRYYIGTSSPDNGPVSRESVEYFVTEDEALDALAHGDWTQRATP